MLPLRPHWLQLSYCLSAFLTPCVCKRQRCEDNPLLFSSSLLLSFSQSVLSEMESVVGKSVIVQVRGQLLPATIRACTEPLTSLSSDFSSTDVSPSVSGATHGSELPYFGLCRGNT